MKKKVKFLGKWKDPKKIIKNFSGRIRYNKARKKYFDAQMVKVAGKKDKLKKNDRQEYEFLSWESTL